MLKSSDRLLCRCCEYLASPPARLKVEE
ncbi:hypothetical protein A2U01_0097857, partial [Trifolium medium]|nr:hypothetical protein [Trifolium medium]